VLGQYDRIVQPGEAGKISLKIRTGKITKLNKTVKVYTNIPADNGLVKIVMKGTIWQPVQVSPRSAAFSRLSAGMANQGAVRRLTVVNNMEGVAALTDIRSTNPAFSVESKVIEPGKKFELIVSLVPPLKPGSNRGKIELSTGIPEMPTLQVPVSAHVTADVDVTPDRLTLRTNRDEELSHQFRIRNFSQAPVTISDLSGSNPALKFSLKDKKPSKPGTEFQLTVVIPVDYKYSEGDKITFKTDCPTVPELTIPITKRIVRGRPQTRKKLSSGKRIPVTPPGSTISEDSQRVPAKPSGQSAASVSKTKATPKKVGPAAGKDVGE